MPMIFTFVHSCGSQPILRLLPSDLSFAAWFDNRGHAFISVGIEKLIGMISTKGAVTMQRLTVRDVMAPLVVSVALTGCLSVTQRSDATGKGPTKIPGVAEHPNNAEKL